MIEFKDKYFKYKLKYFELKTQMGGSKRIHILSRRGGTSSSGKSSIAKMFENVGYKIISVDDYWQKNNIRLMQLVDPNQYFTKEQNNKLSRMFMYEEGQRYDLVVCDDVDQPLVSRYAEHNRPLFVIIVYTSLKKLMSNILSRRLIDPRHKFVFDQFADRYQSVDQTDNQSIDYLDTVNRNTFIRNLKKYLKYLFKSEDDLVSFATDIFKKMGIDDNKTHFIKLRDTLFKKGDYLVKTGKKTPQKIFEEIMKIVDNKYPVIAS